MPDDSAERKSWAKAIARYSAIGLMLPAATFVGWIIGALLDRWLHTTWLYLAGLIFGIAAGFVQLIRSVMGSQSE
jgi:F0F1-type ATP synthase assembly protein I